jgi:predicted DNA-binding transcriptional regulator YafY
MGTSNTDTQAIVVRLAWMLAMLHEGGFTRKDWEARFHGSLRTFRRDLDTLKVAGVKIVYSGPLACIYRSGRAA